MSILNDGQEQLWQMPWELAFVLLGVGMAVGFPIGVLLRVALARCRASKRLETNMPYKVERKP